MAAVPIVTKKVPSKNSGSFTETLEFQVLHCANVTGNNNKFYCIELQRDPSTNRFRLFSNYGRLETSEVFEVREQDKNGTPLTEDRCRAEMKSLVTKKQRGKKVQRGTETIQESYSLVDVVAPTVGSSNIRNASEVSVKKTSAPLVKTDDRDPESRRVINLMVSENIHNITSNTTIKFTSRGFETSLGPVTESHLDKAATALDVLRSQFSGTQVLDGKSKDVRDANSAYFSLIPRKFGSVIRDSDLILTPDMLAQELDLLNNLRTAVQAGLSSSDDNGKDTRVSIDLTLMDRHHSDFSRLSHKFESTKYHGHGCRNYKVKNIFTLNIPSVSNRYAPFEQSLGNIHELFHGTKTANLLSISLNGLIIPPTGAAHVTGRMFGNGVYGASCSTKALNYAVGYWGGTRNSTNTAYVLIVNFAMGKEYVVTSSLYSGAPSGYNSVWAKAGHSLVNDEFIIYSLGQANITHLLELEI